MFKQILLYSFLFFSVAVHANNNALACTTPTTIDAAIISGNVVRISWDTNTDARRYRIRYRLVGGSWTEVLTGEDETFRFLNGLTPNTTYQYQVKTICGTENSTWSTTFSFTSLSSICDIPLTISAIVTSPTSVDLSWVPDPNDDKYKYKYKPLPNGTWTEIITSATSATLSNLIAGTEYKYKIKAKCEGGWTNWGIKNSFTTNSNSYVIDEHIKIDQFGYRSDAEKVAVMSNPLTGFNTGDSFTPGNTYEVRRVSDGQTVFTGSTTAWNNGNEDTFSGDQVWWFDFSALTTAGNYYIFDPTNNVGSYEFEINDAVYDEVLKQAVRSFYYQRCGTPKTTTHGGTWHDVACHVGVNQDLNSSSIDNPNAPTMDLSGGWHDAGDFTKYVNFTYATLHDMLFAYQENPNAWGDDYNIPESGNGIPDFLDEIKYELDWLLKMQLADGSVIMKVGVDCYQAGSPPSADTAPRFYSSAEASSTRTFASVMAHAAIVYQSVPALSAYGDQLLAKAELAWNWVDANPATSNFTNAGYCSANPELSAYRQDMVRLGAAVFLYAATNNTSYRNYFDNNYTAIQPYQWWYWYPFEATIQSVMTLYMSMTNATTAVVDDLKTRCLVSFTGDGDYSIERYLQNSSAYRAYMPSNDYTWGSNSLKGHVGQMYYGMYTYNIDPPNASLYPTIAENYIHYLHGINPIALIMLSNMGDYGGENSCNEFYHSWFGDGTDYDNVETSLYGPAPGFVTGGVNPGYTPDAAYTGPPIVPPQNQPILKSYLDWNTSWPENSWEITENAIYYQASYLRLLSKFVDVGGTTTLVHTPSERLGATLDMLTVFPSPFSEQTSIQFQLEEMTVVSLSILNMNGQVVQQLMLDQQKEKGIHRFTFDAQNLASGSYYCVLKTTTDSCIEKIVKIN